MLREVTKRSDFELAIFSSHTVTSGSSSIFSIFNIKGMLNTEYVNIYDSRIIKSNGFSIFLLAILRVSIPNDNKKEYFNPYT